jgi:hypothetical protein
LTLITSCAERATPGTGSRTSPDGADIGIDHVTAPADGKQPENVAAGSGRCGMVTQLRPGAQSRERLHRSTQRPSAQVPLRQSLTSVHSAPAGRPGSCAVHDVLKWLFSSRRSAIWHDSPTAQSTSLVQSSPSVPVAA